MKVLTSVTIFFIFSNCLYAQWEKYPIAPFDYEDTAEPQWHDINNDGLIDLLGYDEDLSILFWRENDGTQLLDSKPINDGSKIIKQSLYSTGDWNQDGYVDILAHLSSSANYEINGLLLLNDGIGNFTATEINFESEQYYGDLHQFGDFNDDGLPDLIVEHSSNYYVYLNENGTHKPYRYNYKTSNTLSTQLHLLDIDGDNKLEVLEIDKNFKINFHEWTGDTIAITKSLSVPYPGSQNHSWTRKIDFKDLDFDGDLDIVHSIQDNLLTSNGDVGNIIPRSVYVYQYIQNSGSGFSITPLHTSQATGEDFKYALLTDKLNQQVDLIMFDGSNYSESTFENGIFQLNFNSFEEIPPTSVGSLSSTCLFFSNQENLVTVSRFPYKINVGYRSLVPEENWVWENCLNCSELNAYEDIEPVDLDGDGDLDLIVSDPLNKNQLVWIENNLEGCNFGNVIPILGQNFAALSLTIESGDIDGDGDQDLVLKKDVALADIFYLLNDGQGNFSDPQFLTNVPHGVDLYLEDLYQDGFADIIIHAGEFSFTSQDPTTFKTYIFSNQGNIQNAILTEINNPTDSGQLAFTDIDNDTDLDLITYNDHPAFESISIFSNNGSSLEFNQGHEEFLDMYGMNVFDIDQDNFPDILAFHDGVSNNNISTLYHYKNNEGIIDFENPNFIFEDIDRYTHLGLHNPDNSIGFIGKTGFGSYGVLVYYDINGGKDTLDLLNPENYLLADVNNDGFDDILVGDEKGGFNFYSQGIINCSEDCTPDTEGYLYFTDCNGLEYFVIETNDGEILDPYFDEGVTFDFMDGQYVKFTFTDFEIETPCENVRTVLVQCIEETLHVPELLDYDWVQEVIAQSSGCCEIEKIEAYYNLSTRYIYITPRSDCPEFRKRLYDEDQDLLCIEPEQSTNECAAAYYLDQYEKVILYQCDPVATEEAFDESMINIFPNPSHQVFNISTDLQGSLKIFNAQGKCLSEYKNIPTAINLEHHREGLYFFSFENADKIITKKVIKL